MVIEHRGKTVLVEDFSEMYPGPEIVETMEAAHRYIAAQPEHSVLALVDVRGGRYDAEVVRAFKDVTVRNGPFVKAVAVVGLEGLHQVALVAVARASGRAFRPFPDRATALDWLAEQ